ncbi:MAG: hypothetical protein K6E93_06120 [Bacteroidales bacterium]|nr:hypothetical protein [Bacteroidales bacterium]
MKKVLIICAAMAAMAFGASAQRDTQGMLRDYDTILSVRCTYGDLRFYVDQSYHIPPMVNLERGHEEKYHHKCNGDNEKEQAQAIFLARLDKLRDPGIRHKELSAEVRKIVYNFDLVTGIHNSNNDGDFFGKLYISGLALQGWENWLKEHKDRLRFCQQYGVLYTAYEEK